MGELIQIITWQSPSEEAGTRNMGIVLHREGLIPLPDGDGGHRKSQGARASLLGSLPGFLLQSLLLLSPKEIGGRVDLCHRHGNLFDEAGQVYIPFRKTGTFVGAQGDMDLVVHVKPLGMVVQLFSLQGDSCHEAKSPVEVFKMELFEDGISAFQFIPPHSPQVWQQLVPFLSTQPVCLASLEEREQRCPRAFLSQVKSVPQGLGI